MSDSPIKKTKTYEIWDCGESCHNHITETGAQRCMNIQNHHIQAMAKITESDRRKAATTRLVLAGATLASVSVIVGVSASAVRQRVYGTRRMISRCAFKTGWVPSWTLAGMRREAEKIEQALLEMGL